MTIGNIVKKSGKFALDLVVTDLAYLTASCALPATTMIDNIKLSSDNQPYQRTTRMLEYFLKYMK